MILKLPQAKQNDLAGHMWPPGLELDTPHTSVANLWSLKAQFPQDVPRQRREKWSKGIREKKSRICHLEKIPGRISQILWSKSTLYFSTDVLVLPCTAEGCFVHLEPIDATDTSAFFRRKVFTPTARIIMAAAEQPKYSLINSRAEVSSEEKRKTGLVCGYSFPHTASAFVFVSIRTVNITLMSAPGLENNIETHFSLFFVLQIVTSCREAATTEGHFSIKVLHRGVW